MELLMPCSVQSSRFTGAGLLLVLVALLGIGGCGQREESAEKSQAAVPAERGDITSNKTESQGGTRGESEAEPVAAATAQSTHSMDNAAQTEKPIPEDEASVAETPPETREESPQAKTGSGRNASELAAALSGEDAVARFLAEEQLVEMGDEAVAALKPLATSSGFTPGRQYAIIVLARIANDEAIAILLQILGKEPDVKLRAIVCTHLGRLGVEEAVPIIGKWLFTIEGKSMPGWYPGVSKPTLFWLEHVYALRAIGSEEAIPILERMQKTRHGGQGGGAMRMAYQECLVELESQAKFWRAVRHVPGLEPDVELLFEFFRKDMLASVRLYRDKIVRGGLEGRWVLEDMKNHTDDKLRKAAETLLTHYGNLRIQPEKDET